MSHEIIIQVSKEPIKRDEWITQDRYYNGFVGSIADRVDDSVSDGLRSQIIERLDGDVIKVKRKKNGFSFKVISRDKYFEHRYRNFISQCNKCADIKYEEFCNDNYSLDVWRLDVAWEDRYGAYIDDNDEYAGLQTFDAFMRRVKDGDVFYIGAVIDYHY